MLETGTRDMKGALTGWPSTRFSGPQGDGSRGQEARGQRGPMVSGGLQHWVIGQWIWIKLPQIKGLMFLQCFSQRGLRVFSFGKLCKEEMKAKRVRFGTLSLRNTNTGWKAHGICWERELCSNFHTSIYSPWDLGWVASFIVKWV